MHGTRNLALALATAAATAAILAPPALSETVLEAQSALARNFDLTKSFLANLVEPSNKANKGAVQIKYLGGPEINPSKTAWKALKDGGIHVLQSPVAYYIGTVPEGYAFTLSQKTPVELRANGGFALLQKIFAEKKKAHAKLLAWGESGTSYNTYLAKKPGRTPDGKITLKGLKMRVTGTYRPLFTSLGAQTIGIKPPEIYTAMQRGVVDGFGWPDVGLVSLGIAKVAKYRIDPNFYRANMLVTVNLKKWNELSAKNKAALEREAIRYERESIAYMENLRKIDEKKLLDAGMKVIKLEGEAAKHYLNAATSAVWEAFKKRSKNANALKKLSFPDLEG